jgi:50S ribosomal subunit-associated GTPase HflX
VLAEKKEVIVLNKIDLDSDAALTKDITDRLAKRGREPFSVAVISAVTGQGVGKLNETLWAMVKGKVQ